jgi:hypothetical protein
MQQRIEYAHRQALDAWEKARECSDNRIRAEWEKAAQMWEAIIEQYKLLTKLSEASPPPA